MKRYIIGALSGLAATWPMTAAMVGLRSRLPSEWFTSLPPRRITLGAAKKAGLLPHLGWKEREAFTWASHFGFGAAAGALFAWLPALLSRKTRPAGVSGPAYGILGPSYGLLVWAVAYLGLMPALGLHPMATRDKASRTRLMILSHLVWGFFLGLTYRVLEGSGMRGPSRSRGDVAPAPAAGTAREAAAGPVGHTAAWERQEGSPAFD